MAGDSVQGGEDRGGRQWNESGKMRFYPFFEMTISVSRAIRRWFLREILLVDYFKQQLRRNFTRRSEQSVWIVIDNGDRKVVVPLDWLLLIGVCIYQRLFTSQCTVQEELAEVLIESVEQGASFEK